MIGRIGKNHSFQRTTAYVLSKPGARIIGGNLSGQDTAEIVREFQLSRSLKPEIERPVYHVSLSLPHDDHLDDDQFAELGKLYLQEMGLDPSEHQFLAVHHGDRKHSHIHLVVSRISLRSGAVASDSHDRYRSQAIIRTLEDRWQLTPTQSSWEIRKKQAAYAQAIGQRILALWKQTGRQNSFVGKRYRWQIDRNKEGQQRLILYRIDGGEPMLEIKNPASQEPTFQPASRILSEEYLQLTGQQIQPQSQPNQPLGQDKDVDR